MDFKKEILVKIVIRKVYAQPLLFNWPNILDGTKLFQNLIFYFISRSTDIKKGRMVRPFLF